MKGRCIWVVRSPRQHSITLSVTLLHASGAKIKASSDAFFSFAADGGYTVLHFLFGASSNAYGHLHFANECHIVFHNHHGFERPEERPLTQLYITKDGSNKRVPMLYFCSYPGTCPRDYLEVCSHGGDKQEHGVLVHE